MNGLRLWANLKNKNKNRRFWDVLILASNAVDLLIVLFHSNCSLCRESKYLAEKQASLIESKFDVKSLFTAGKE